MTHLSTGTEPIPTSVDRPERLDPRQAIEAVERLVDGGTDGWSARLAGRSAHRAHAEQFLAYARTHAVPLDGFWARRVDGRVIASVLAVPNAGRTAILFASTPRDEAEIAVHAETIRAAAAHAGDTGTALAQVLLDPREERAREAFRRAGFHRLARLGSMERPIPRRVRPVAWPDGLSVEPYDPGRRDELIELLDATYEDTLDCPGLRGLRRTEDILAGHLGTGEFDPAWWLVLRDGGVARGVILLSRSAASRTVELVYIGLAPEARGRGFGGRLLQAGLNRVAGRAERAMTLAVDEANEPAIALYRQAGFRRVLERVALIQPLSARA